jgi:hypothetical protein
VNGLLNQIAGLPGQAYDYVTGRAKALYEDPIGDIKKTLQNTKDSAARRANLQKKAFGDKSDPMKITDEEAMSLLSQDVLDNIMSFAPAGIVKSTGGQFLKGRGPESFTDNEYHNLGKSKDVKQWLNTVGKNYIRDKLATVDDPLRKLANEGIVADEAAIALARKPRVSESAKLNQEVATRLGVPGAGRAVDIKTPQAAWWDNAADEAIYPVPAANYQYTGPHLGQESFVGPGITRDMRDNPWLAKVPPNTPIHQITHNDSEGFLSTFKNVSQRLQDDLDAGLIRPEQLSKISMPDAVIRTHQGLVKKIAVANNLEKTALVHKEYPTGDKWVELGPLPGAPKNAESDFRLKKLLGNEGKRMQNCVGEYCKSVGSGHTKIYSLRDAKGDPHVTVEVKPPSILKVKNIHDVTPAELLEVKRNIPQGVEGNVIWRPNGDVDFMPEWMVSSKNLETWLKPSINQIRAKNNSIEIKPKYQPLVDDFIGDSTRWGSIKK